MNTRNMPGFTASKSLYTTSGRYRAMAGSDVGLANAPAVLPQLARQLDHLLCLQRCSLADASPGCQETCDRQEFIRSSNDFGRGGGGRSGPRGPGELVCGPCIRGRQSCGIPGVGFSLGPCVED